MKLIKNFILLVFLSLFIFACEEGPELSEVVKTLTGTSWKSDSLLLKGLPDTTGYIDASETYLSGFYGTSEFNEDGTGNVGIYKGTWALNEDETILTITSDSLSAAISVNIIELTSSILKVGGAYPILVDEQPIIAKFRLVFTN